MDAAPAIAEIIEGMNANELPRKTGLELLVKSK